MCVSYMFAEFQLRPARAYTTPEIPQYDAGCINPCTPSQKHTTKVSFYTLTHVPFEIVILPIPILHKLRIVLFVLHCLLAVRFFVCTHLFVCVLLCFFVCFSTGEWAFECVCVSVCVSYITYCLPKSGRCCSASIRTTNHRRHRRHRGRRRRRRRRSQTQETGPPQCAQPSARLHAHYINEQACTRCMRVQCDVWYVLCFCVRVCITIGRFAGFEFDVMCSRTQRRRQLAELFVYVHVCVCVCVCMSIRVYDKKIYSKHTKTQMESTEAAVDRRSRPSVSICLGGGEKVACESSQKAITNTHTHERRSKSGQ